MPGQAPAHKKDLLTSFKERETRAKERLSAIEGTHWYFAVVGAHTAIKRFTFDFASLQAVEEPPGEIELARALKDNTLFGVIGRYSHYIRHELAVSRDLIDDEKGVLNMAWWFTSLLHIKTLCDVIIPCVADCSWSTVAAFSDNSREARLLDDVPTAAKLHPEARITMPDCEWAVNHLAIYTDLLETPKFRLAVDSLTRHHHLTNDRMMAAAIWSGIEALFEIESELRFRLSAYIAAYMEERGPRRRALFNSTKKLYDFRSKVVHGVHVDSGAVYAHVVAARELLARLLQTASKGIESPRQTIPTRDCLRPESRNDPCLPLPILPDFFFSGLDDFDQLIRNRRTDSGRQQRNNSYRNRVST